MTERKIIEVKEKVLVKKSPNFREVIHKAQAGLSESEAIEKHIVGRYEERDGDDADETSSDV